MIGVSYSDNRTGAAPESPHHGDVDARRGADVRQIAEMLGHRKLEAIIIATRTSNTKSWRSTRGATGRTTYEFSGLQEVTIDDASRPTVTAPT